MSRCFPFPPPGYEKKPRTDDPDLLIKEKQREKHKKKKNKEKRENKEKKDKYGSDEKHRVKKDKKEKYREKKKDKDCDKDKERNISSDEKRLSMKAVGHDGEKTTNEKKLPWHNGEKFVLEEKEKNRDRKSNSGEKTIPIQYSSCSRESSQNGSSAGDTKDSKFVHELGRRVGDERTGKHLAEKFSMEQRRDEGIAKWAARSTGSFNEGRVRKDERGVGDEARFSGNVMVQKLSVQTRVDGLSRPQEKDSASRTEGRERTKQEEGDDRPGDKSKYINREKNEQRKDKEKKKAEKVKVKSERKNTEKDKLKLINEDDHIATHNNDKTLHGPKNGNNNAICDGNSRKRKSETNGFCHANDIKQNKLLRPTSSQSLTESDKLPKSALSPPLTGINKFTRLTSSFHSLPGNGSILEPCQIPALCTSANGGAASNLNADIKDGKLNGVISQSLSVSAARPPLSAVQTNQISSLSTKPPHPDTKYLSRVLLVPKMEDFPNSDDQEWLFSSSNSHSKMPKLGSSGNDEMPEVWAGAMRIQSADVYALPYVVVY